MDRDRSTPVMLYAGITGAVLVVVGIVGFFYNAEFTSDVSVRDSVFGVLDVNGWHNLVHVLAGVLGLLAYGAGAYAARSFAMAAGTVFLILAVWGFIVGSGDSILSIIPVNTEDNVFHLLLGVAGVWAAVTTPAAQAVRPAAQT